MKFICIWAGAPEKKLESQSDSNYFIAITKNPTQLRDIRRPIGININHIIIMCRTVDSLNIYSLSSVTYIHISLSGVSRVGGIDPSLWEDLAPNLS